MNILGKAFRLFGVGMPVVVLVTGMILAVSMHLSVKEAGAQGGALECMFRAEGSRQFMFRSGKVDGNVLVDHALYNGKVYGFGQVNMLQGDIVLYDGKSYLALPELTKPVVEEREGLKAVFLAYGSSEIWQEIPIEYELFGMDEVEEYVVENAKAYNTSLEEMFVFRIEGPVEYLKYGVIRKDLTDSTRHTPGGHSSATIEYELEKENVNIVGAWAGKGNNGSYTERTENMRMYMINEAHDKAGHIENIHILPGAKLYWPNC